MGGLSHRRWPQDEATRHASTASEVRAEIDNSRDARRLRLEIQRLDPIWLAVQSQIDGLRDSAPPTPSLSLLIPLRRSRRSVAHEEQDQRSPSGACSSAFQRRQCCDLSSERHPRCRYRSSSPMAAQSRCPAAAPWLEAAREAFRRRRSPNTPIPIPSGCFSRTAMASGTPSLVADGCA